jgi:hypothetical protein
MQLDGFPRSAVLGLLDGYWVGTGNVELLAILADGVGFVAFDTTDLSCSAVKETE